MGRPFPNLPIGTEVAPGVGVGRVLEEGLGYQLLQERAGERLIWLVEDAAPWLHFTDGTQTQRHLLTSAGLLDEVELDGVVWLAGAFSGESAPVPVSSLPLAVSFRTGEELLGLAGAIAKLRSLKERVCWRSTLYARASRLCIATELERPDENRLSLAIALLTGGVADPVLSDSQIKALNRWISLPEIRQFFETLGLQDLRARPAERGAGIRPPEEFSIPGRPELETLFREHVIDYLRRRGEYRAMGSKPPNGILIVGPPGTGKSFAVRRLAEFLKIPFFEMDMGAVGSPYIHETSRAIRGIFEKAAQSAPSLVLMEEIDAFASGRGDLGQSHKAEEVAELLRAIESASESGVLVLATSNRPAALDSAIVRRGRFDHVVHADFPTQGEVLAALEALLRERPSAGGLPLDNLAALLAGRPLSDVAWVVNEAARRAVRANRNEIDEPSLRASIESLPSVGGGRVGQYL